MKLSIVIVNYNVEYFLEQCLQSVHKAIANLEAEVWVVDNASVDGSCEMVKQKFPWVKLIESKDNLGFSAGNNLAIRKSSGEYVLLLNPDTVVEETTFEKTIDFMDEHPDAGGLGVHMVDGQGNFLPESKRGLPTPWVSFCKIFGLSKLFPKSERFNQYHLGHLDKSDINEIDILSGAFMLMRKKALDEVGLLDEDFFMYGEDIDLSWRLIKGGYKNYYYPETSIIHYKGESTKKGSLNYVFVFYNAMVIFAKKHFTEKNASLFSFFINLAIYLRAGVAIVNRFLKLIWLPFIEFLLIYSGLIILKNYYSDFTQKIFDDKLVLLGLGIYALLWVMSLAVSGSYKYRRSAFRVIRGIGLGTMIILLLYALLPESVRFSRALILLGSLSSLLVIGLVRQTFSFILRDRFEKRVKNANKYLIVGDEEEFKRVTKMIEESKSGEFEFFPITINAHKDFEEESNSLNEKIRVFGVNEVIFCAKNITSADIISAMSLISVKNVGIKIAPPESMYIIGSNTIDKADDLLTYDVNSIGSQKNRRIKRLFDVISSTIFFVLSPVLIWITHRPFKFITNIFAVLFGQKTWVGYDENSDISNFPSIKEGVITSRGNHFNTNAETANKINLVYAKDYRFKNDVISVIKHFRFLGN